MNTAVRIEALKSQLKYLGLSVFLEQFQALCEQAEKTNLSYLDFLHELVTREFETRQQRRLAARVKQARFPYEKLLSDFDIMRIPKLSMSQLSHLASGEFIDYHRNLFIFGNPGTGKTHLSLALMKEWCLLKRKVRYFTADGLVQSLLKAKQELKLTQYLKQLDSFEVLMIDNLSYKQFNHDEAEILFVLLAERYEKRSLLINSHFPLSQWDRIFKDAVTTPAMIDRLVHHSIILELQTSSYRADYAKKMSYI